MRIYIPFNTNDFNSVLTTLSISPIVYYSSRNYSYKRATNTYLNPFDDLLIAYSKPVFTHSDYDHDDGFTVNVEIEINHHHHFDKLECNKELNLEVYAVFKTLFLFNYPFKFIFRKDLEKQEVSFRSLKSIETKYAIHAINTADIALESDTYLDKINKEDFTNVPQKDLPQFQNERSLNKIMGALLGYSIGYKYKLPDELSKLKKLSRNLNNLTSLFYNEISTEQSSAVGKYRNRVKDCLNEIKKVFDNYISLEEVLLDQILENNTIFNRESESIKNIIDLNNKFKLYDRTLLEYLLNGLINESDKNPHIKLPPQVLIQKCLNKISGRLYKKYYQDYIDKVDLCIGQLKSDIQTRIDNIKHNTDLDTEFLLKFENNKFELRIKDDNTLSYFISTISFLVRCDEIKIPDNFQEKRKQILQGLAMFYRDNISSFKDSDERKYLLDLNKSFDDIRSKFNVDGQVNDVLKCLSVLFLMGRDLTKYIESIELHDIESIAIAYSIWGAAFGHANIPKTLTEQMLSNKDDYIIMLNLYKACNTADYLNNDMNIKVLPELKINPDQVSSSRSYSTRKTKTIDEDKVDNSILKRKKKKQDEIEQTSLFEDHVSVNNTDTPLEECIKFFLEELPTFSEKKIGKNSEKKIEVVQEIISHLNSKELNKREFFDNFESHFLQKLEVRFGKNQQTLLLKSLKDHLNS